jgi:hypothetical protein
VSFHVIEVGESHCGLPLMPENLADVGRSRSNKFFVLVSSLRNGGICLRESLFDI